MEIDGVRILIVEDSDLMAEAIKDMLLDAGAVVVSMTASVNAALDIVATQSIDLACLDINLGKEDSFPVADELVSRSIPFVFVSGGKAEVVPPHHRHQSFVRKSDISQKLVPACWNASRGGASGESRA